MTNFSDYRMDDPIVPLSHEQRIAVYANLARHDALDVAEAILGSDK